jgi:hypothetical protein
MFSLPSSCFPCALTVGADPVIGDRRLKPPAAGTRPDRERDDGAHFDTPSARPRPDSPPEGRGLDAHHSGRYAAQGGSPRHSTTPVPLDRWEVVPREPVTLASPRLHPHGLRCNARSL